MRRSSRLSDSTVACDPLLRVPTLPASVGALVKRATAQNPDDRFASARDLGAALGVCLAELGASSKERDVTAALSALLESTSGAAFPSPAAPAPEAVPDAIEGSSSGSQIALNEVEIIEASGPLPVMAQLGRPVEDETRRVNLPVPPEAFARGAPKRGGTSVVGWRTTSALTPEAHAELEPAVHLFNHGLKLRAEGRHGEALDAWEKALALAPENRLYQSQTRRLRAQLSALRESQERDEPRSF